MPQRSFWSKQVEASEKKEFVRVLTSLADIKRVDLTKETYEMWWNCMRDWTISDFSDAAGFLLKNCQFMPTPFDFEQLRKKREPSAHEAWAKVMCHVEGAWRQGVLGDALIDRVIAMLGGYRLIALTSSDKLGFLERRFMDAYNDLLDTGGVRAALPRLTERARIRHGAPVQIGDIAKASV